jgi:hypothetical protein
MPILYALIARQKSVLAEYTGSSGNFPTVTRVLLTKIITDVDSKRSFEYDEYVFHCIVDLGITFLCMADSQVKPRIAYTFLDDVKALWRPKFGSREQNALAFGMNESFAPVIKLRMVCVVLLISS